jgi:hypothetical protein
MPFDDTDENIFVADTDLLENSDSEGEKTPERDRKPGAKVDNNSENIKSKILDATPDIENFEKFSEYKSSMKGSF